jgi:anti-sigma-K factor RskA
MRCDAVRELIPLHALGLLEGPELAEVRRHLEAGCPRCAAELAAAGQTQAAIPFALEKQEPSPHAKARLMARVRNDSAAAAKAPRERGFWARAGLLSAAAALAAALLTGTMVGRRYEALTGNLRAQIRSQREELARLRQEFSRARDTILLVRSPGSKVVDLQGQNAAAASAARVFWDVRRGTWRLYPSNLPPAGPGKTYQLWLVTSSRKISAGVFPPAEEASGTVSVPVESGPVVALAVTPEPEGGSPQPTGEILLLGKL